MRQVGAGLKARADGMAKGAGLEAVIREKLGGMGYAV
jgi:hypothetical protein